MKKQIAFLGAAAAALMVAGTAHAEGGGYVGLSYASNTDTDIDSWGINGAVAPGQNFQLDASFRDFSDADANAWNLGAHLFSRSEQWLWGGYVGYDTIDSGSQVNEWTVALQTQFYMPRTTLSGDVSYSSLESDLTTWAVRGEARFFATDNFSFQGNLGWANISADGGGDDDGFVYGIGAEFQPDTFPVSFYGGWQSYNFDTLGDTSSWEVGVRYNWGGTLLDRNRHGAGLSSPRGFLAALFG